MPRRQWGVHQADATGPLARLSKVVGEKVWRCAAARLAPCRSPSGAGRLRAAPLKARVAPWRSLRASLAVPGVYLRNQARRGSAREVAGVLNVR